MYKENADEVNQWSGSDCQTAKYIKFIRLPYKEDTPGMLAYYYL